MISGLDKDLIWTCNWDTISLAQVPSFLLISAPKLSSSYSMKPMHGNKDALLQAKLKGANAMRNQSNNLSIRRLRIVVNATSGAIDYSGDDTGFIDSASTGSHRRIVTAPTSKRGGSERGATMGARSCSAPRSSPLVSRCATALATR